jgi:hypothetical protein
MLLSDLISVSHEHFERLMVFLGGQKKTAEGLRYGVVTFNSISVISWPSVLLVEESRENHRPATSH